MALTRAAKRRLDRVADHAATFQLASESAARHLTNAAVEKRAQSLVARVASEGAESRAHGWSAAARAIRAEQAALQDEFTAAMLEARSIAREFAMRQVAVEAEPLAISAEHALVFSPTLPAAEVEAMWAHHAATSVSRRFGSAAIGEASTWRNRDENPSKLPARLARVAEALQAETKLHSVTQSVAVFNEAKAEKWRELKEGRAKSLPLGTSADAGAGAGDRKRDDDADRVYEVWSAILDAKTCPVCWKHDGEMALLGKGFPEGATPPLHGHCRCTVLTIVIPRELEKWLPGASLDYDVLKDDIKAYMGDRSFDVGEGVRHAERYVDEVLERRGQSPIVLADRVNNRGLYFPNIPRQRAPLLRW